MSSAALNLSSSVLRAAIRTATYPPLLPVHGARRQLSDTGHCADSDDVLLNLVVGWDPVAQGGFSDVYRGEYTRNINGVCTTSLVRTLLAAHYEAQCLQVAVKVLRVTCHLKKAIEVLAVFNTMSLECSHGIIAIKSGGLRMESN